MNKYLATLMVLATPLMSLAAEGAGHSEKSGLPPSLNQGLMTAIVTLIIFLALVIILTKTAWGPIAKSLGEREAKIRRDIDEAEAARKAAVAEQQKYQAQLAKAGDEVRAILDKARADAQSTAANIKLQAQQEAEEAKERAVRDIEASRKAAIAEIHNQAAEISTSIASKILARNINANDQQELVRNALQQLGNN